ncbi:hypothetical protein DPMN_035896 [Dreissena polymorpha]|uniref:CUB domain-containing protein n=1 Tax=Dreissena polymorpha TaxID=45954 RepID=A0A9D4MAJ6_DREPO|nr:hypothetical protein DPMN_035896 [Dreissena polymorpha]
MIHKNKVVVEFQLRDFTSEESADIATIYVGSLDPTRATVVGQLSGTVGTRQFRSFNNLMIIVFSTDSEITLSGFSGIYGSCKTSCLFVYCLSFYHK